MDASNQATPGEAPNSEAVEQFVAVTGCAQHVAQHYLASFNGSLDRSLAFFFDHGGAAPPLQGGDDLGAVHMTEEDAAAAAAALQEEEYGFPAPSRDVGSPRMLGSPSLRPHQPMSVDTDDEDDEQAMLRTMAHNRAAGIAAAREAERTMEAMMAMTRTAASRAGITQLPGMLPGTVLPIPGPAAAAARLAGLASLRQGSSLQPGTGATAAQPVVVLDSDTDEELEQLGSRRARGVGAEQPMGQASTAPASTMDEDEALARRLMAEEDGAAMPRPGSGPLRHVPHPRWDAVSAVDDPFSVRGLGVGARRTSAAGASEDMDSAALGVDRHELEEARMIEAAMLGIPYQPRLPIRASTMHPDGGAGAQRVSAAVYQGRHLRQEQDDAFEESLAADRAKAAAEAEAARAAQAALQAEAEAKAAAVAAAAEAERQLKATLSRKAASLPPEPAPGDSQAVTIMVRLPDGSRCSRKFTHSTPLQAVFDWLDVQHQAATHLPGSYALVTQYPRKVYQEGTAGSLAESGITADTALYLDVLSK